MYANSETKTGDSETETAYREVLAMHELFANLLEFFSPSKSMLTNIHTHTK